MANISVVLATFNEEKNLPSCLDSIKDWADEIIIVDGSSKDKTIEIAKKFGAKVLITDNHPIFHINKQKAINMATKDWILQLDADEIVTPELASEIKGILEDYRPVDSPDGEDSKNHKEKKIWLSLNDKSVNGYWIPRKNWFLGRFLMKGGIYPDYTLRLYKRGKGRLPQKSVHEQTVVEGKVGYLKNPLIHMADKEFSRYWQRLDRYTNLIRDELKSKKTGLNPIEGVKFLFLLPMWWFILTYFFYKGFMDSWQGFVFSFFSSLRFPISYLKYLKIL